MKIYRLCYKENYMYCLERDIEKVYKEKFNIRGIIKKTEKGVDITYFLNENNTPFFMCTEHLVPLSEEELVQELNSFTKLISIGEVGNKTCYVGIDKQKAIKDYKHQNNIEKDIDSINLNVDTLDISSFKFKAYTVWGINEV